MVKKLKKYVKFIVCMTLIMGLMVPSYAALSASDGSAFVTKAEFDSALADFNARLTTFEAGINSKIDSQVTSYLDRNGIWSGKDQVFLSHLAGYGEGGIGTRTATDLAYLFWLWTGSGDARAYVGGNSSWKCQIVNSSHAEMLIVKNITKSGLMCLKYNLINSGVSERKTLSIFAIPIKNEDSTDAFGDLLGPSFIASVQFQIYGDKTSNFDNFPSSYTVTADSKDMLFTVDYQISTSVGTASGLKVPSKINQYAYFFVDKDTTLYYKIVNNSKVSDAYTNDLANTEDKNENLGGKNVIYCYLEPLSIRVY